MQKRFWLGATTVLWFLLGCWEVMADGRRLVLLLDVSGSMNEEGRFISVLKYVEEDLFPKTLKNNDTFTLILFGDEPRIELSEHIKSESDINTILTRLKRLKANDNYTDLGKALEYLFSYLTTAKEGAKEEVQILFITDGKNAPPRTSPYYGKNLSVDAKFQDIGRKISQEGWFIYVVGIGKDTDAKTIAQAVQGAVLRETDSTLTTIRGEDYTKQVEAYQREKEMDKRDKDLVPVSKAVSKDQTISTGVLPATLGEWIDHLAKVWGVPSILIQIGLLFLLLILLSLISIIIWRRLRPIQIRVWDTVLGRDHPITVILGIGSRVVFNHPPYVLPSLGKEEQPVLQFSRSWKGIWIELLEEGIIRAPSSFKVGGKIPFKKQTLELASGEKISYIKLS
ncbi:MAG: vWA domain-containing protein [Spirochaetales bacterium]